jgi:hypothetical protein
LYIPGKSAPLGKAVYEQELEKEEQRERFEKQNPVIEDGAFRYRFHRDTDEGRRVREVLLATF